ncbi:MAG: hypothetical protein QHH10_14585, partial [Peptococcaceae bacterium]|nr:hypothetical protein [Peptococcaceae bacterium]
VAIDLFYPKNRFIKNKSLDEQKHIIQTYVKKVTVNDNSIEVNLIVDIDGKLGEYRCQHLIRIMLILFAVS